jgi:hypothetical protein
MDRLSSSLFPGPSGKSLSSKVKVIIICTLHDPFRLRVVLLELRLEVPFSHLPELREQGPLANALQQRILRGAQQ